MDVGGPKTMIGWSRSRKTDFKCKRCPRCEKLHDMLSLEKDEATCYRCKYKGKLATFIPAIRKVTALTCRSCGNEVTLTDDALLASNLGWMCMCDNVVAVRFRGHPYQPDTVLKPSWNKGIAKRSVPLPNGFSFAILQEQKDYLVVNIMNSLANTVDGQGFRWVQKGDHTGALFFGPDEDKYLGYIIWTEGKNAVLRQIYVVPDERRKGLAEAIVQYWVATYADPIAAKFGIESPNEKTQALLVKLGYARGEADAIRGVKCYFVPSV